MVLDFLRNYREPEPIPRSNLIEIESLHDEKNVMLEVVSTPNPSPARQASDILRAWVRQDRLALREEFEKGLSLCTQPDAFGFEDEQVDLLKAVVSRLSVRPGADRPDPGDPVVRLCITLLMHLAGQS